MNKLLSRILLVALLLVLPLLCLSWTKQLIDAANALADGKATRWQKAYLFANNDKINHMGLTGKLSDRVYQKNQTFFQNINDKISARAATRAGLTYDKQKASSPTFKAGTDTDNLVGKGNKNITLRDIQRTKNFYNQEVEKFLKNRGYKAPSGADWSRKTDTDFMPHASDTKQFNRICKWINKNGGTAYESGNAATIEKFIRSKQYGKITTKGAIEYTLEMDRQINHKLKMIDANSKAIAALQRANPKPGSAGYNQLQDLQAMNQKMNSQVAKYLTRKQNIANIVAEKLGIKNTYQPPSQVYDAADRRGSSTKAQASYVGKNARALVADANRAFAGLFVSKGVNVAKDAMSRLTSGLASVGGRAFQETAKASFAYARTIARAVSSPDKLIMKGLSGGTPRMQVTPGSVTQSLSGLNKALGYGGKITSFLAFYDIAKEAYTTGNYKQGAVNAMLVSGMMYVTSKGVSYVFGSFIVANPVTATAIGVFIASYSLTREFMSRVTVGGKSLDQHTQDWFDDQLFQSGQYDVAAKADIMKMYMDSIKKGHKLPEGMSIEEGWKIIEENYNSGGRIFEGVFYARGPRRRAGAAVTKVESSIITNYASGKFSAADKSRVNVGIQADRATIKNSIISSSTTGTVNAINKSKVNTGVNVSGGNIKNSSLSATSNVNINAISSNVSTGIELSGAENSRVSTNVNATINARNSNVDVGAVKGSVERKRITTNVTAGVDAKNESKSIGSVYVSGGKHVISPGGSVSVGTSSGVGNVVVNSDKVKEVNTVVGSGGKIGSNIKTKHMSKQYEETGGVDPQGNKYIHVTKEERRKADKSGTGAGNTVIDSSSNVKKVNTLVE